jgi:hypothetical protein
MDLTTHLASIRAGLMAILEVVGLLKAQCQVKVVEA